MIWLLDLVDDHRAAVKYDLLRHGYRLEWLSTGRLPWGDAVAILSMQDKYQSAVYREQQPLDAARTASVQMLELLAVLARQTSQAVLGVAPADWDTKFSELVEQPKPEPVGLDLSTIDQLMGW